jgi:hypothetical protein
MVYISDSMKESITSYILGGASQAVYVSKIKGVGHSSESNQGSCHGRFMGPFDQKVKYEFLATSVGYNRGIRESEYERPCQEYIRWILSEDSPWHNAIKGDYELIFENGSKDHIRGVILGPSVFEHDNVNHSYIYNFLLASRITRVFPAYMETLGYMMYELGIPIFESMIMMPYFARNGVHIIRAGGYWNAAASALRESCAEDGGQSTNTSWSLLDLHSLKKGDYNFKPPVPGPGLTRGKPSTSYWSSYGWLKRNEDNSKNLLTLLPRNNTKIQSRFTTLECVDPEQIIKFAKDMMKEKVEVVQPKIDPVKEVVKKVKKFGALR